MQIVTLLLAILASCAVAILQPTRAFVVYITVLLYYPVYLVVQLGSLNLSVGRIVVAILLYRCLTNTQIMNKFKWCRLDSWLTFMALLTIFLPALFWKLPVMASLQNVSGQLMDTYFAYLVARLCINDFSTIVYFSKMLAIALAILSILGLIESLTGHGPYVKLILYCPWLNYSEPTLNVRSGFFRASGAFSHPILFGTSFAMFVPFVFWLRHLNIKWQRLSYILTFMLVLGTFSSMSSGPIVMLILVFVCLTLERSKYLIKPILIGLLILVCLVEIFSNRTFYHVFATYADPLGGAGWHRAKLIDLAIEHISEWWLIGYRQQDPGWGPSLGMSWTDITNQYIIMGVKYGIFGIVTLAGILIAALRQLYKQHLISNYPILKSWHWALGTVLLAFIVCFNSFTIFGQTNTLFYCLLGFIGSTNISASYHKRFL